MLHAVVGDILAAGTAGTARIAAVAAGGEGIGPVRYGQSRPVKEGLECILLGRILALGNFETFLH